MSFSITESDVWPRIGRWLAQEVDRRTQGLRTVAPEHLVREQAWIEAFQAVLDEAAPKPSRKED